MGFIGKSVEVEKAILYGLQSNVNQLEKLLQASCGDGKCNCDIKSFSVGPLKKLQKTFNDIDKIERQFDSLKNEIAGKSKASVGTPSGSDPEIERLDEKIKLNEEKLKEQKMHREEQITQLKTQLEAPKKEIKNTIDSLTEEVKRLQKQIEQYKEKEKRENDFLKDADISIPSHLSNPLETAQAKLKSHKASLKSLESLEKLITFHKEVKNADNKNCKTLLTNLCTGLEKFLGYQNGNYTGEGIVYSDLDRLCDGVMAFLLQCLKGSYSTLKHYNKNIDDTIRDLSAAIGKGHGVQGFRSAIGSVQAGLRGYERELGRRTGKVVSPLQTLLNLNIKDLEMSHLNLKQQPVESQINQWTAATRIFSEKLAKSQEALNNLDKHLRRKLEMPMQLIEQALNAFMNASKIRDIQGLTATSASELKSLQSKVERDVEERITKMENILKSNFKSEIQDNIDDIKTDLIAIDADLGGWINEAEKVIHKAVGKCYKILRKVQETNSNALQTPIGNAATTLKTKAIQLRDAALAAKAAVQQQVEQALTQVVQLDKTLKLNLNDMKVALQMGITSYVRGYVEEVQKKVKEIKGEKGGANGKGLEGIKKRIVEEYAQKFRNDFGKVVQDWIKDILETDVVVKEYFNTYVKRSHNGVTFNEQFVDRGAKVMKTDDIGDVAGVIKQQLENGKEIIIKNATIDGGKDDSVQANIDAVEECITTFVASLDKKIRQEGKISLESSTFVFGIANKINDFVVESTQKDTSLGFLKSAVAVILAELSAKANQVLSELGSFTGIEDDGTGDNLGKNIDAALQVATDMDGDFDTALVTSSDQPKYKSAKPYVPAVGPGSGPQQDQLDANIQMTISEALDKKIGKGDDGGDWGKFKLSEQFNQYLGSLTVPANAKLTGNPDANEGQLPEKIGDIKREVTKKLTDNGIKDIIDERNRIFEKPFEAIKEELSELTKLVSENTTGDLYVSGQKGVKTYLLELQNGLKNEHMWGVFTHGLGKIQERLNHVISAKLVSLITKAKTFNDQTIPEQAKRTIQQMNQHLREQVANATNNIKNKAQSLCAERKHKELQDLKAIVEVQQRSIKYLIQHDTRTGVKGFLKELSGTSVNVIPKPSIPTRLEALIGKDTVALLAPALEAYFDEILTYTEIEVMTPPASPATVDPTENPQSTAVSIIHSHLSTLLSHLSTQKHFTHEVPGMLAELKTSVQALTSTAFANPAYPVLDAFPKSLLPFVEQLEKGYVSTFSGRVFLHDLVKTETKNPVDPKQTGTKAVQPDENKYTLTEYGEKCAKIILTILNMLNSDLNVLKNTCENPSSSSQINKSSHLGDLLTSYGYRVATQPKSQDGHLKNKEDLRGKNILDKINDKIQDANSNAHLNTCSALKDSTNKDNIISILRCLTSHLHDYFRVGHITASFSKKHPCSVFDMLCWTSGLKYNMIYEPFSTHCRGLVKDETDIYVVSKLSNAVTHGVPNLSPYSHNLLTTILGTGDAYTIYASDYYNNSLHFHYPSNASQCLAMLLDMLRRMLPTLRFLQNQCNVKAEYYGWSDCQYGKDILTSKLQCNDHPTDKPNGQPRCQPSTEPKCQPNDKPNCQPTSPLQSFLTDGLPGHLPHQLISVGCKSECLNCSPNSKGMPCLTPLGFRAFSGSTRTGKELCNVLINFFENVKLSSLFCQVPKPPSTLPEHFSFALSLANGLNARKSNKADDPKSFAESFKNSIKGKSIYLYEVGDKLTNAFTAAYGSASANHSECDNIHLKSLTTSDLCKGKSSKMQCAPYVSSLYTDAYKYMSNKNCDLYLSWATYLPWTFWDYLQLLLSQFQQIFCSDWGCRKCMNADRCKKGKHGEEMYSCHCKSLVSCKGVSPTLYKCGFGFGDVYTLNEKYKQKTCYSFQKQLNSILQSKYFRDLFEECDEFLKKIRWPFMLTLLALWSLSLLYLLHIAVVRLDVLRIRSHLRSPASHRIAAQSLLAAARVKALANVKQSALDDVDARRISLGQLAGQLSDFIGSGQEVQNALLKGLHSNVNQLEKLLETSCGGEGCCDKAVKFRVDHLKMLQETFEKYDEIENKINGLNKLKDEKKSLKEQKSLLEEQIEKLKSALNKPEKEIESLISSINEKIDAHKKEIEAFKNANKDDKNISIPYSLSSKLETAQAKLQSHEASLESIKNLEKLITFHEGVNNSGQNKDGNCNDILKNLTEGLEKFLGHSNGNYTGEGIVYSDLDRLCDGVMSFLHGVLHHIKPTLGLHRNKIDEAIRLLNANKHSGKDGFNTAIVKVVQGVRQYNEGVENSNNAVKKPIKKLQDEMEDLKNKVREIHDSHSASGAIDNKVTECLQQARDFIDNIAQNSAHVSDLSDDLERNVNKARDNIAYQRSELDRIHRLQQGQLREVVALVEQQLNDAKSVINETSARGITAFVSEANKRITTLKNEITETDTALTQYVSQLNEWINKADAAVAAALDKVEKILNEVGDDTRKAANKERLVEAVRQLESKALTLYHAYTKANGALPELANQVRTSVAALDLRVRKDLFDLKGSIDSTIHDYVVEAKKHFNVIKDNTLGPEGDGNEGIMGDWKEVASEISKLAGEINGEDGQIVRPHFKGLEGIIENIKEYAARFTKVDDSDGFGSILKQWIKDILETDPVKSWLAKYIEYNRDNRRVQFNGDYAQSDKNGINTNRNNKIAEHIKGKLGVEIGAAVLASKKVNDKREFEHYVQKIQYVCSTFAEDLGKKLKEDKIGALTLAKEIEKLLTSHDTAKDKLQTALYATLHQLVGRARQVAEELKSFTTDQIIQYNLGNNIHAAIEKVKSISGNVTRGSGQQISLALGGLINQVSQLEAALKKSVQMQVDKIFQEAHSDSNKVKNLMRDYAKQIGAGVDDGKSNTLYGAIKNLQENALQPIKQVVSTSEAGEKDIKKKAIEIVDTKLSSMCDAISKAAQDDPDSAKNKLEELKEMIGKNKSGGLKTLQIKLSALQRFTLNPLIDKIEKIMGENIALGSQIILEIDALVTTQIDGAKNNITAAIKTRYVTFIKEQLTEFTKKATKELDKLPDAVERDGRVGFKGFMNVLHEKLESSSLSSPLDDNGCLSTLIFNAQPFFNNLFDALIHNEEILPKHFAITKLHGALNGLLNNLTKYDRKFATNLDALGSLLNGIRPSSYDEHRNPLLHILRGAVQDFYDQLDKAYISVYDSESVTLYNVLSKEITADGIKCAQIVLTMATTLYEQFYHLFYYCRTDWSHLKVDGSGRVKNKFDLQDYLVRQRFMTNNLCTDLSGHHVAKILTDAFKDNVDFQADYDAQFYGHNTLGQYLYCIRQSRGAVSAFYWSLADYNKVCHLRIPSKSQYPCSVRDMLSWMSGLPYTKVFSEIKQHCTELLRKEVEDAEKKSQPPDPIIVRILNTDLYDSLRVTVQKSYDTLVRICGHGRGFDQAAYPYAYSFCNNSRNFYYPNSPNELFDMLREICTRVLKSLCFLHGQCMYSASHGNGWRDCQYGKHVKGYRFDCDKHSDASPNCLPKSPLQAHLMDGLPGLLPHSLQSVGCKSTCSTCRSIKPGQQCITPMGFGDLTHAGSITGRGEDICKALGDFCCKADSPLCVLLYSLKCLSPYPPKSLADMFSFHCNIFQRWSSSKYMHGAEYINKIDAAIHECFPLYIGLHNYYVSQNLTSKLKLLQYSATDHSDKSINKGHCDLWSLSKEASTNPQQTCSASSPTICAPYLKPLCDNAHHSYPQKYASVYASWLLYLASDFWDLLKGLLSDFQNIDCGGSGCTKCYCKPGQHGIDDNCKCNALVRCQGVLSTLYKYGFTYGNPQILLSNNTRKWCRDFNKQLKKVIDSEHFKHILEECEEFIWAIRTPFSHLLLALWSLSLLYLLHIAVVRLDVLRIRSHLRSPSSHRIAAQSLLAAARVKALANVKYFSP
ncbi:hypothetical protein, conserved [Babesia ovata]|uniref:C3H1-type domain-containing protein n=1 Tax=Babesia ovata TaxID=189622 RepID=A0A2H6KAC7_9APIC|nr:uncharacterized protein BOVATA_014450 [Babesia ovata]GBE59952.1 hypothetical protein, conserved [Babesia ovata]